MAEDFKTNFLPRLEKNKIYKVLHEKCNQTNDFEVISLIHEAVNYACERAKIIIKNMGEYTLHDSEHLFKVLSISSKILGESNINKLSIPELQLLILSVFFHDLGMAPDEKEILAWRKVWDNKPEFDSNEEENQFSNFRKFWFSKQELQIKYHQAINIGNTSVADEIKSYAIADFIRATHANRAREIINKDWKDKIIFRDYNLSVELANLCYSHNESIKVLNDFDKKIICGEEIYVCLPLLAILLRLSDILDFDGKRTPKVLYDYLFIRNPVSLGEWKKHRSIEAWEINESEIVYSAKCTHPVIQSSIHSFCDIIDYELGSCNNILQDINGFNYQIGRDLVLKIPYKVNRTKIVTKTNIFGEPLYIYRNTKFELSKKQVIELLMGTKLYGNPEVALRELIQNSIDACLLRKAQENKWGNLYEPHIEIKLYQEDGNDILEVADNGTGMDQYIVDNYYSKVGASFYKSSDFYEIKSDVGSPLNPTSRFGIGILSCFMISDLISVETRRVIKSHDYAEPLSINIEGEDSIFYITKSNKTEPGTKTKLTIRKGHNPWVNYSDENFILYVENLVPKPPFNINISKNNLSRTINENALTNYNLDIFTNNNHTWKNLGNIKIIEFAFDESGIKGKVRLGILEKDAKPVSIIEVDNKEVIIENVYYPLKKSIRLDGQRLFQDSTLISVNDDSSIITSNSHAVMLTSMCKVSFHGIDVPHNLMTEPWQQKANLAYIRIPFQMLLVLDISGEYDLDLNSPRTEIINSGKWVKAYTDLSKILCIGIRKNISDEYWQELVKIYSSLNCDKPFLDGLSYAIK